MTQAAAAVSETPPLPSRAAIESIWWHKAHDDEHVASRISAFWVKVLKTDTCWEWMGHRSVSGYGIFALAHRNAPVHRISYVLYRGEIPHGFVVDHLCRNRGCVNPDHLEAVTSEENTRRGRSDPHRGRCSRGHEYTPENTIWYNRCAGPNRKCRTCVNARSSAWTKENRGWMNSYQAQWNERNPGKQAEYQARYRARQKAGLVPPRKTRKRPRAGAPQGPRWETPSPGWHGKTENRPKVA